MFYLKIHFIKIKLLDQILKTIRAQMIMIDLLKLNMQVTNKEGDQLV